VRIAAYTARQARSRAQAHMALPPGTRGASAQGGPSLSSRDNPKLHEYLQARGGRIGLWQ
jgi:hypothetical protein